MTTDYNNATETWTSSLFSTSTKRGCITTACSIWLALFGVASAFGFNKQNTFDVLRDMNNFSDLETFAMIFGQQLCALLAFTALEIREDWTLPPNENAKRGIGTLWPRSRVYQTIYIIFPLSWTTCFATFMAFKAPINIFSNYDHESWATWIIKMVAWFVVWEFFMYNAHRIFHKIPSLYAIAHKGHHVVMDFPLGPHAPALEKLSHYVSSIVASKIVGVSAGSWILALNILMTQCVLEHAYSSFTIPIWHSVFAFNTADLHQTHHIENQVNFGYAFNIFDPIFGTLKKTASLRKKGVEVTGPATAARIRLLQSGRFKRANLFTRARS